MASQVSPYWGTGIYSIAEAARLTGVRAQRIRRWLRGYIYSYRDGKRESSPVWQSQLSDLDSEAALGFLDLMQVRFVNAFIEHGVSLHSVRLAAERAANMFNQHHPFCTPRFRTDGRTIFMDVGEETEDFELLDLVRNQFAFEKVLRPYLKGIEYEDEILVRWWPLGVKRRVVVDPARSFGAPITSINSVPTSMVANAVKREDSVAAVASWLCISQKEVRDAVQFERRLAA